MAAKIKQNDKVIVTAGGAKGQTGKVLRVDRAAGKVFVESVNMRKKHKKEQNNQPSGIEMIEGAIDISNVAHVDPRDGKATRIGFRFDEHGRKTRYAKRSGEQIDV